MKGKAPWIILLHTATLLELFHCTQAGYVPPASDERIFMNKRRHWIIPLHMLCYVTSASNIYVYEQKATLLQFFHCLRCCCTPSLSVSSSAKRRANWWNWFAVGVLAMILIGAIVLLLAHWQWFQRLRHIQYYIHLSNLLDSLAQRPSLTCGVARQDCCT